MIESSRRIGSRVDAEAWAYATLVVVFTIMLGWLGVRIYLYIRMFY